ncbi:hypothetical protein [Nitrosomonas sp.]|uniref:hypothetical protein n=1 Tax=Nitrosomonas sp. TaxID=42353 RepID=UPI0026039425|nr:hypothetical protein [Nitrosomonas sp.]
MVQTRFAINILPEKSGVVFEELCVTIRIFIGKIRAGCMHIISTPYRGVVSIDDQPRCIEVFGVNIVNLDRAGGCGFSGLLGATH